MPERPTPAQPRKQEHNLFCVIGTKSAGHTTVLIIAANEADATYYALDELGFVTVSATYLVSDSVLVGPADIKRVVGERSDCRD